MFQTYYTSKICVEIIFLHFIAFFTANLKKFGHMTSESNILEEVLLFLLDQYSKLFKSINSESISRNYPSVSGALGKPLHLANHTQTHNFSSDENKQTQRNLT